MVRSMPSKALLSQTARLKASGTTLPARIADLDGCTLIAHCDCCGRHLQLYPGHAGFDARMKLTSLLDRLVCGARRNGRVCGGLPRRLVLMRDERQWVLDASGEWLEDEFHFWEAGDFEAHAARSGRHPAF
jgi:hypothetical protein